MSTARFELNKQINKLASGPAYVDWKAFVDAFRQYTEERKDALVASPPEQLQFSQGYAQACVALLEHLRHPIPPKK